MTTTLTDQGPAAALLASTRLEPFQVTRTQLHELFNSPTLVKKMIAAGWILPVRPGKPGRETLFDYLSAKGAFACLKAGEEPPPLPARAKYQNQEPS
jgi:hypothetical protein